MDILNHTRARNPVSEAVRERAARKAVSLSMRIGNPYSQGPDQADCIDQ